MMKFQKTIKKIRRINRNIRFFIFETDNVMVYWPDFSKGILILGFGLIILIGDFYWYVSNYNSENHIWFNESYYDYRVMTTWYQLFATVILIIIAFIFKRFRIFRRCVSWFIPIYFGVLLIYSAHTVGIYSPAAVAGVINIVLIGFVFYQPKVIMTVTFLMGCCVSIICYMTSQGYIPYAPLFSDALNESKFYQNGFWIQSMAILYLPVFFISMLFFVVILMQWRRREKKIEDLSRLDSLTNVYNRRFTSQFIKSMQAKKKLNYGMILMDLDYFKSVNDTYGHDVGDVVLRRVAQILKLNVRAEDIVGRFGGEEFIIIVPELELSQTIEIAERCRIAIENEDITLDNNDILKITASFGVAHSENHYVMEEMSRLADKALYKSKREGRNKVSHYLELVPEVSSNFK